MLTNAQVLVLRKLESGWEVTFKEGHYTAVSGDEAKKLWPSTFYGLFNNGLVERMDNGNYTISYEGQELIK